MVQLFARITWEYAKSVFKDKIETHWPQVVLGFILNHYWIGTSALAWLGEIGAFLVKIGEILLLIFFSKIMGAFGNDVYKLSIKPKIIKPVLNKINKLLTNGRRKKEHEKRA